jgi:hypothetical protein
MAGADGVVGSGDYTYRVVADWAKLPIGWTFRDVAGDIYVGEVSWTAWQTYTHPGEPVPPGVRSLQKLVRVPHP